MSGPGGVPEPGIGIIDELATALMDQWAESEHEHSITKNPVSYVATFVELARVAYLLVAPRIRSEREAEIAALIRKNAATLDSFAREGSTAGLIAYLIDNVMATPEEDMGGAVLIEPGRPDQDGRDLGTGGDGHDDALTSSARTSQPGPTPPTFDALLSDPMEQFDTRSGLLPLVLHHLGLPPTTDVSALMRSVEEYRNATPAAFTAPLATPEPVGMSAPNGEPLMAVTLCEHGSTRAHRRRLSPSQFLDCPGPVATPTEPGQTFVYCESGLHSIPAGTVCESYPCDPAGQEGEPLTDAEVNACLAEERGEPDWAPTAAQDGQP